MRVELAFTVTLLCSAAAGAEPVLLTPVRAAALEEGERALLDDAVRAEVLALGTLAVIGRDEQRAACDAIACDGALACSVARGKRAGAQTVLVTDVSGASELTIRMSLVDVAASMERHTVVVSAPRAALRSRVREAVVRTLAPDRYVGRVNVTVADVEAEIVIDGVTVGRTPLLAAFAVAPARHELEVRADGHAPYKGFVDVPFDSVVAVDLEASGGALVLRVAAVPAPPSASPPVEPVPSEGASAADTLYTAGVVAAVAGGAVLLAGAVVTLVAFDQKARFERNAASVDEIRANLVLGPTGLTLLGIGALGVGVGAALIGTSVALAEPSDEATAPQEAQ